MATPYIHVSKVGDKMKTGVEMIAEERARHAEKGYNSEHDATTNKDGRLARAAICYAQPFNTYLFGTFWPWHKSYWKPETLLRCLVKAGALIAAEIDRIQAAGEEGVG